MARSVWKGPFVEGSLIKKAEKAGVVVNDRLIVSWDGSRIYKDAKSPRVIFTLEAA